ncbi:NYN domain-containing protein [Alkalinema sp. FACHB-956]|uniref:NYN domain-containing protein n=1 Tax=Alkalinema sp. FACHB-956 TaxID=2692768 RepID=UPI0016857C8F|nr:NYN domain-containing protein [Alkalinema sp. FACHB-956]MBD2329843.1 NYN domain-containing protein [Alkalinema sp. FACHB-956]
MAKQPLVHLFCDVENIPAHRYADYIRQFSKQYGRTCQTRLRVYAVDWVIREQPRKTFQQTGFLILRAKPGDNAVDNKILRDGLSFSKQGNLQDIYILITGDGDYVQLVEVLRERGKYVICLTSKHCKSSQKLLQSVHEHYFLEDLPQLLARSHEILHVA